MSNPHPGGDAVDAFAADPVRLRAVLDHMDATEKALERITNHLEQQMAKLDGSWDGETAEAQRLAHAEWEKGLTAMRHALVLIREGGDAAHYNYTEAVQANLEMWESIQ